MGSTALAPAKPPTSAATTAAAATSHLTVFLEGRRQLFGIAYRILGSAAEAEDVVQDVWLRWQLCDRTSVREPLGYLVTTTTRAAINVLQSARVRHETSLEPTRESTRFTTDDPSADVEREEALERATYLMMERLTPAERAAFVLRVGLDYPYARIAAVVQTSETAARQLVSRARKHLAVPKEAAVDHTTHRRFLHAFRDAARGGDATVLELLLTQPSLV